MKARLICDRLLYLMLLILALSICADAAQKVLSVINLQVDGHRIEAEVAATSDAREAGLMFRRSMAADRGMLLVFSEDSKHCIWMKDTYMPLSVAFADDKGVIVGIIDMKPLSLELKCAPVPVRYALEMNSGWFLKKRIGAGKLLEGLWEASPGR
jgi:uncharacterized protein